MGSDFFRFLEDSFGFVVRLANLGSEGFKVRPLLFEVFSNMFIIIGFVGSEFWIFGGFGWVRSSVLVDKLGFGRVRSSTSRVRSSSKFKVFSKMFIVVGFW